MISGRITGKEIDQNGKIMVHAEYTLTDGTKKTGSAVYNPLYFSAAKVQADVQQHCEILMRKVYQLKQSQVKINEDVSGVQYDCTSAEIVIEEAEYDKDGNETKPEVKITVDDK